MTKWTAILFFIGCLHVSAKTTAQRVEVHAKSTPLPVVLKSIEQQSGYYFVYLQEWMDQAKPVTASFNAKSIDDALHICLNDQPFTYKIVGKTIALKPARPADNSRQAKPAQQPAPAPEQEIVAGTVTDSTGTPISNVSVLEKGTHNATVTSNLGRFVLSGVNPQTAILEFKYVGYRPKEIKLNGEKIINATLYPSHNALDAVQIMAYGTTTRRYDVGNITTIGAEDIKNQPVSNIYAAIQGMVPGLEISTSSGDPGTASDARIRGINSVSNVRGVLVLIDGVPGDLNAVPPSDVASISVLKDASATAIYGARGSDGVILITTKKGSVNGGSKIQFHAYNSIATPTGTPKVLNTAQYRALRKEAFENDHIQPTPANAGDLFLDSTVNTNWEQALYHNALTQDYNINLTGGSGDKHSVTYYLSGGYHKEDGILKGDWSMKRTNMRVGIDAVLFDGFLIGGGIGYTNTNSRLESGGSPAMIYYALPIIPLTDSNGNTNLENYYPYYNPNRQLTAYNLSSSDQLLGNAYIRYTIWDNLVLRTDINYEVTHGKTTSFTPTTANITPSTANSGSYGHANSNTLNFEPKLSYEKAFGQHYLKLLVGGTLLSINSASGNIFTSTPQNAIDDLNTITAGTVASRTYEETPYRFNSLFGRLNYKYKNQYLFEGVLRRDGSSRFGPDSQFGTFFSLGAGWIFSEQPVIKNWLGNQFYGKLRANYGSTGNDNIANFGYLASSTVASNGYNGNNTIYVGNIPNPDIKWELTKKMDIGVDLELFHSKLLLTADYFRNRTTNTLFSLPLSVVAGYNGFTANLPGIVENTGTEFSASLTAIDHHDFSWKTQFNISTQKNELISLPGLKTASIVFRYKYKIGQPLALNWGYKYEGVDPATGVAKFEDVDGNGIIASYTPDWQVIGKTIPDFYGGWNNQLHYKRFDMQVFTQFAGGVTKPYNVYGGIGDVFNLPIGALARWQQPGDITDVPRAAVPGTPAANINRNLPQSDFAYSNASYIRLKNVTFGYTLSSLGLKKAHITSLRVYLTGYNLLTFTGFKGGDPESGVNFVPMTKTYTLGVSMEF